jgi:hypothetical protein
VLASASTGLATSFTSISTATNQATGDINTLTQALSKTPASIPVGPGGSNTFQLIVPPGTPIAGPAGVGGASTGGLIPLPGSPAAGVAAATVAVNVNVGGPVVGSNGMQQLTQIIQNGMIQMLQTRGVRLTRG